MTSATVINLLYLAAALLWLSVSVSMTLQKPPVEELRPGWPLRKFWVSEAMRRTGIGLLMLSVLLWFGAVMTGATGGAPEGWSLLLLGGAVLLVVTGLAALVYTTLLYRGASPPELDRF